jgi:hypothetical protein
MSTGLPNEPNGEQQLGINPGSPNKGRQVGINPCPHTAKDNNWESTQVRQKTNNKWALTHVRT